MSSRNGNQSQLMPDLALKHKYIEGYPFQFCNSDSGKYEKMAKIYQGTYGEVFRAREKMSTTKKSVAMKEVLMDNGFPIAALREIRILQQLQHENVINLIEICRTQATESNSFRSMFYLVFDFCEHDLGGLLYNVNVTFSLGEIKSVVQQLLKALSYIHTHQIMHRDIKPNNVLITKNGVLKLANFGLARTVSTPEQDAPNQCTKCVLMLWYRSPELLLGDRNYGPPVDMWGAGCIMAEMWTRSPIMQGFTVHQQICCISHMCGSITPDVWPGVVDLQLYDKAELPTGHLRIVKQSLQTVVPDAHGCDLIDRLLQLDPSGRIDANTALEHEFFWTDPKPVDLSQMLSQHSQSMFSYVLHPRRHCDQM